MWLPAHASPRLVACEGGGVELRISLPSWEYFVGCVQRCVVGGATRRLCQTVRPLSQCYATIDWNGQ